MSSTTAELESAMRTSLWSLLHHETLGMDSSLDVAGAVASVLSIVHQNLAEFSLHSNRTRGSVLWNRLPDELKLETAHWLPHADRTSMLGVSRDVRKLLLSDTSLWTTICLGHRPVADADWEAFAEFVHTAVARSGSRPVDFEWTGAGVGPLHYDDPIRDIILSVLPRTRTLVLCPSFFRPGPRMFWTTPTPLLVKLTISDGTPMLFTLGPSWSIKQAPLLRELTLNGPMAFDTPPLEPFRSVRRLEAAMGIESGRSGWEHVWTWFPCLETLVLQVEEWPHLTPAALPSPPDSLRHVILYDERVVRQWSVHSVKLLEILSHDEGVLRDAVGFLERCEPAGLWSISFTDACCLVPEQKVVTVLRGSGVTVIIWPDDVWAQSTQIRLARARATLTNRVQTLVVSSHTVTSMFRGSPTFPNLRSLTVADTNGVIQSLGPVSLPALERLTIDLSFDSPPEVRPDAIAYFIDCIKDAELLRDITIRLPTAFDPHSRALEKAIAGITTTTRRIHTEFASPSRHMDPCVHYRPQSN